MCGGGGWGEEGNRLDTMVRRKLLESGCWGGGGGGHKYKCTVIYLILFFFLFALKTVELKRKRA